MHLTMKTMRSLVEYNPKDLVIHLGATCLTFGIVSAIARVVAPKIGTKQHAIFGQVQAITFVLLYDNKKLKGEWDKAGRDPNWNDFLKLFYFVTLAVAPIFIAKLAAGTFSKKIPYKQAFKWGACNGAIGLSVLFGVGYFQLLRSGGEMLPGP